jgi:hypothetical protein
MKAHYLNETGDVAIIRPLIYTREVWLTLTIITLLRINYSIQILAHAAA